MTPEFYTEYLKAPKI